ncbi:MAG: sulfatase [Acidothermales bacterium]|nr:sulfatase [Acidothermales bacterium]
MVLARRLLVAVAVAGVLALVATAIVAGSSGGFGPGSEHGPARGRPNIVLVLTDDMSWDLARYVGQLQSMQEQGTTFDSFFVGDSLCCTSRSTVFTGLYPHNTHVLANRGAHGGWPAFVDPNEDGDTADSNEKRTFAVYLNRQGYHTGFVGKYLNGYPVQRDPSVPTGWDEWNAVGGGGYREFGYQVQTLRRNGRNDLTRARTSTVGTEYATDYMSDRAVDFLDRAQQRPRPFFLEVATYAPHQRVPFDRTRREPRFPPASRDRPSAVDRDGDCGGAATAVGDCTRLDAAHSPAFDEDTSDKPSWVRRKPLTAREHANLTEDYRNRVRMMQSVDDLLARVRGALTPATAANTYVVFAADNGFHLGQHRLLRGKQTPYDHDIRVPAVVVGPGVLAGVHRTEIAQNTDFFPTFLDIAGVRRHPPSDGMSLLPLLHGEQVPRWRTAAFVEHTHIDPKAPGEVDDEAAAPGNSNPPTYQAIRTASALYVEYRLPGARTEYEYYDLRRDRYETADSYGAGRPAQDVDEQLAAFRTCGDGPTHPLTCQRVARRAG